MSKTRLQLANAAVSKLIAVGTGQSPDAEDTQKADSFIDDFAKFISNAGIYTIADLDEIEHDAFQWLAMYLAWFCAEDFKKVPDESKRQMAEYQLRRIQASRPTYEVLRSEYF